MQVIIVGCGRVGALLSNMLDRAGHQVTILDKNADSFRRLDPEFRGEKMTGTGMDEDVLKRAGIDRAEAFIAVTNGDNTNVMAGQIAQRRFRVPRVIVRVYDPIRAKTYRQFGLETICSSIIGAGAIHDLLMGKAQRRIEDYLEMGAAVNDIIPDSESESAASAGGG